MVCRVRVEDAWSSTSVELEPVGYQFPSYTPTPGEMYDEWDANWLRIRGKISTSEITRSFTDPCLTTAEAAELEVWLRAVAAGKLRPSDTRRGSAVRFLEPNVWVRLAKTDGQLHTLTWFFSQESSPPGADDDLRFGDGHPVDTALSTDAVIRAADEWASDRARFPERVEG